uniref:Hypothetical conserved protein n=1 Tax=Acetithermum autotrophicum TaxID=1446466 RepID=H5SU18_ACEAU|nr:hypothetical conserved protein [Candidatus Acetothermum autotrophicum]
MKENQQLKKDQAEHDWHTCWAVERAPGKVSGAWVFRGTRVPVRALFENLRDGASIEDFLRWFPGVQREQVEAVLNHELESLTAPMPS